MSLTIPLIHEDRWNIAHALYEAYPRPVGETLLLGALGHLADAPITLETLHRDLEYLKGHGRLRVTIKDGVWLARLTPTGIDWIESETRQNRRRIDMLRMLRMRILQALDALRLRSMTEKSIEIYLRDDEDLDPTPERIHAACCYLVDLGMAAWTQEAEIGILRITSVGVDYLEGSGDNRIGIKRMLRL